jgi:hypothetical protein
VAAAAEGELARGSVAQPIGTHRHQPPRPSWPILARLAAGSNEVSGENRRRIIERWDSA